MAETIYKGKIKQKDTNIQEGYVVLHPETEAELVAYENTIEGTSVKNVKAALNKIVDGIGVKSVNGKKGDVTLVPGDIGAQPAFDDGTATIASQNISTGKITITGGIKQTGGKIGANSSIADQTTYTANKIEDLIGVETTRATAAESGLSTRIETLEGRGRFLSLWDCTTGLPVTDPQTSGEYEYKAGDYYIVSSVATNKLEKTVEVTGSSSGTTIITTANCPGVTDIVSCVSSDISITVIGSVISSPGVVTITARSQTSGKSCTFTLKYKYLPNFRPSGSSYIKGQGSTSIEPDASVQVNDTYVYDKTNWILQKNTTKSVAWSSITGKPTTLVGYGIDADDSLLQKRAKKVNSGKNAAGTDIESAITTNGVVTLGDALTEAISIYSVVKVNKKGIVIDGGQSLEVIAHGATPTVVDGGWYFEENA